MRYERLRQLRMEKGMTQTALAHSLSVSKAAISTYENGLRNPPDNTLVDMAHFFNVSVDYLMTGEENPEDFSDEAAHLAEKIRKDTGLSDALKKYFELSDAKKKHVVELINLFSE